MMKWTGPCFANSPFLEHTPLRRNGILIVSPPMDLLLSFWHFITHLNETLPAFINDHGNMVYVLLFMIIFIETGLVVMPFLPGDSLLFVAGSLAAIGTLNIFYLLGLLIAAAILGDNINYWIGRFFGGRVTQWKLFGRRLVREKDLAKTHGYFEKYGVRTIIIARFVPIVRTITPFVAGIGKMDYRRKFLPFDIMGGVLWITLLLMAGFAFGQHPFVQKNYEVVILGIVFISVLPMLVEFARLRMGAKQAGPQA
jgi:membrane-associated protein